MAKALGVGDQVDSDDLPACDREAEHNTRSSARSPHGSHSSVHQRRLGEPGTPREGVGHRRRTADLPRGARTHSRAVSSEHDVWVKHREQRVEITAAGGSEEGVMSGWIPMATAGNDRSCRLLARRRHQDTRQVAPTLIASGKDADGNVIGPMQPA